MRIVLLTVIITALCAPGALAQPDGFTLREIPDAVWEARAADAGGDGEWLAQTGAPSGSLSMGRAILYSLVLPGWGDYYAGRKSRARYFFISEAAIWSSFVVFRIQGHRDEDRYKDFAVQFAGVTRTDHSDDFYAELRQWDTSTEYENFIKSEGRPFLFPDIGDEALDQYFEQNRLADFEPWAWESFERRLQYSELRSASKNAYQRSEFAVAAAVLNRAVAAVFAYQAVKSQRNRDEQARYHIDFNPPPRYAADYEAAVSVVRTF